MPSHNFPINLTNNNPLVHSPLTTDFNDILIAPGTPKFIVTETSFFKIATESLVPLVTES